MSARAASSSRAAHAVRSHQVIPIRGQGNIARRILYTHQWERFERRSTDRRGADRPSLVGDERIRHSTRMDRILCVSCCKDRDDSKKSEMRNSTYEPHHATIVGFAFDDVLSASNAMTLSPHNSTVVDRCFHVGDAESVLLHLALRMI